MDKETDRNEIPPLLKDKWSPFSVISLKFVK